MCEQTKATVLTYEPVFEPTDCRWTLPASQPAECGYLAVPENRSDPACPTIRIAMLILHHPGKGDLRGILGGDVLFCIFRSYYPVYRQCSGSRARSLLYWIACSVSLMILGMTQLLYGTRDPAINMAPAVQGIGVQIEAVGEGCQAIRCDGRLVYSGDQGLRSP